MLFLNSFVGIGTKRNIQLMFVAYTTIITVLFDLNVAVISGTIFFYLGKKIFTIADAEDDYSEVHGEELHGQSLDTVNVKINNNDTSH